MSANQLFETGDIVMDALSIAAQIPALKNLLGEWKANGGKADEGWLKKFLLAVFTTQDNTALVQFVSLLEDKEDKRLVRAFIGQMRERDGKNNGPRVSSFAAGVYLLKNPVEVIEDVPAPQTQKTGKGQKGGKQEPEPAPAPRKRITRTLNEGTSKDARVVFLKDIADRIKTAMEPGKHPMGYTGTAAPKKLSEEQAISRVIDEMQADGSISEQSFQDRIEKLVKELKEKNVPLLYTMFEARRTLGEIEYGRTERLVREKADREHPNAPKTYDPNADDAEKTLYKDWKSYYEAELECSLESAMRIATNLHLPEEERIKQRKRRNKEFSAVPKKQRIWLGVIAVLTAIAFIALCIFAAIHN